MKRALLTILAFTTMITFAQAEMKCEAGKCGSAMKANQKVDKQTTAKPKTMTKMFQSVSKGQAILLQDGSAKPFCPECGMTLPIFFKTNHAATVNGKVKQYCSLHCVVDDSKKGSKLTDIKVVDVSSLKFIDVSKATYVVGSSKKGTMSMVSKYAFASKDDALAFAKANGGEVVDYKGAYSSAQGDFGKDNEMLSKKQAMMAQKGEMIYGKMCQETKEKFTTVSEAKTFVVQNKLCKNLNAKQMQAVGLYLTNR